MGPVSAYRPGRMALLAALGLLAIFLEAAPLAHQADSLPSPELLFLVVAHFAIRRPGSCPMLLVFALGLTRDLVTDVPPGLGALTLVAASEALRSTHDRLHRTGFAVEWLAIAAALALLLAALWLGLAATLAPVPPVAALARQWAVTVALYPFVALVLRWVVRIGWTPRKEA